MTDIETPNPKRRWYQYSLRTLFVLMTLFAIFCSWYSYELKQAAKRRAAVEAIRRAGGQVYYILDAPDSDGCTRIGEKLPTLVWLQPFTGQVEVFSVSFSDAATKVTDAELQPVGEMPELQHLFLDGTHITGDGLKVIEGFTELEVLSLDNTQVTDAGLKYIHDLPRLRFVDLANTSVTDDGLRHLRELPGLQDLTLDGTQIADATLLHLRSFPHLKNLGLDDTQVTDAGLRHLEDLPKLEWLEVINTQVTDEGVKKLQEALPNCEIYH